MATFGELDIVVNNASAIQPTPVSQTDMKRFDLMHGINARGTFMVSKFAIPYLEKAANPHILMISPPLDMQEKWFAPFTAYAMAKFGMSLVVLGLAGELRGKVAVNALWPRTTIATAAIKNLLGGDVMMRRSRKPEILADAAYRIFQKQKSFTGNFLIDDTGGACDDLIVKKWEGPYPWKRQHPAIDIIGFDGISESGQEVYNFCKQEGITNIALMGVHTNICILNRSFGIRQMTRLGFQVVLARDLTDAMYDPRKRPFVSHARGTELVIEHIEAKWCPSILGEDLTRVITGSDGPSS